ncbi:unnamed protein product [marine sediment metagenome]|uniref:Uncharacterized protein n=1 Tax=marine sediment metagenome TaxID=412755 RepID=X1JR53_9ZZZZ
MTEKIIYLDGNDPVNIYGVKNKHLDKIKGFFPKLKIVARGNELKVIGKEEEIIDFELKINILVNAARLYKIDPENALERTNQKFIKRFAFLEDKASKLGKLLKDMSLDEMDKIWEEAKRIE